MWISLKIVVAFAGGFLLAQLSKMVIYLITHRRPQVQEALARLEKSGGMPSGHAASMLATTTYLGLACGFDAAIFALALCLTAIVIYDATNVRFSVGEQGKLLQKLTQKSGDKTRIKISEGHTWPQVIVGGMLGVVVGILVFCWLGGYA